MRFFFFGCVLPFFILRFNQDKDKEVFFFWVLPPQLRKVRDRWRSESQNKVKKLNNQNIGQRAGNSWRNFLGIWKLLEEQAGDPMDGRNG